MRYQVIINHVDGRHYSTIDDEEPAKEWLWRTLKHMKETWPRQLVFAPSIYAFEKVDE